MNRAARVTAEGKLLGGFKDGYLTETSEKEHNGVPVQVESSIIQLECQSIYAEKWIFFFFLLPLYLVCKPGGKKTFYT